MSTAFDENQNVEKSIGLLSYQRLDAFLKRIRVDAKQRNSDTL